MKQRFSYNTRLKETNNDSLPLIIFVYAFSNLVLAHASEIYINYKWFGWTKWKIEEV